MVVWLVLRALPVTPIFGLALLAFGLESLGVPVFGPAWEFLVSLLPDPSWDWFDWSLW